MEIDHGVTPRRGRPRDPDAEPRIRRYAVQLLLERGFDKMTVDDVAEAAGVGKATIYRRWASKEELANDAMADLFDIEIPDADTGSLEGDLREVYGNALTFVNNPMGAALMRLGISEANRDERSAAIYRGLLERRIELTRGALERAWARGEPIRRSANPVMMVEWLSGLFVLRLVINQPMPAVDEVDYLVELTMRVIREPSARDREPAR
ncbi:TetR/AcrR family transcriptional regulator [Kribbella sandramycini]|uniref:AcrR family transcriptional regulator n=1 Tax=Kribbella sandramycini TaxID=60450 RepID=A0A7Y4P287_9ACTN|nr:TetR/AcrR family transcriptional regulator [Kribbella sandramycini]MBB6570597.1 AcrR family transcriptional regulator [Kribbella sandramycini]NOL43743.1 TetR/AcrR family transcriptional regulator [Kribbella sandramycini]